MRTEIIKVKGDWQEVVDDCRTTVSKPPLGHEPSNEFKQAILIAEHSPIRNISIKWVWRGIKSWIATHFSRSKWECFISTQRTDRTGVDRDNLPQGALVNFTGEANIQHLIDTSRKRLCFCASPETREKWEDLKCEINKIDPNIAQVMVPNCIYRFGCPEMGKCQFFKRFLDYAIMEGSYISADKQTNTMDDISYRYKLYNEYFYERKRGEQHGNEQKD